MPCYTIRRTTVDLAIANVALLELAFKAVPGMKQTTVHVDARGQVRGEHPDGLVYWANGKLYLPQTVDANAFKRAYAAEVIKAAAKQQGWHVTQPTANKFLVTKGGW